MTAVSPDELVLVEGFYHFSVTTSVLKGARGAIEGELAQDLSFCPEDKGRLTRLELGDSPVSGRVRVPIAGMTRTVKLSLTIGREEVRTGGLLVVIDPDRLLGRQRGKRLPVVEPSVR